MIPIEVTPISNTEVTTFNTCERRHYYEFILNIEPRMFSLPLYRGIAGHAALEAYYKEDRNLDAAHSVIKEIYRETVINFPGEYDHLKALEALIPLIERYHYFYGDDCFEVIEVEKTHVIPMSSNVAIGSRLDLLIRFTRGPYRGDLAVMDNKFVHNFMSQPELDMNAQGPKYVSILKREGLTVSKFVLNQIRHRAMKTEEPLKYFQRPVLKISPTEAEAIWQEHLQAAKEIQSIKDSGTGHLARRILNPYICKMCPVQRLCKAELAGRDITNMAKYEFNRKGTFNDYGYQDVVID